MSSIPVCIAPLLLYTIGTISSADNTPFRSLKRAEWASSDPILTDYKAPNDWSQHYDEEWKFLYEEPEHTLADAMANEPSDQFDVVFDLMQRVTGKSDLRSHFVLELIDAKERSDDDLPAFLNRKKHSEHPVWRSALYLDVSEVDRTTDSAMIILRGSSTIALTVAFNWYLESWCNTTYDWRTYALHLPTTGWPVPSSLHRRVRSVPFSYYENVCTVSYTQAFWTWQQWQPHLDWMALQGINLPLAFVGQEYIFAKTFAHFNFSQSDLQAFFSGPAFFAWQRMGNLRGWAGPLTESAIVDQYNLQLLILARMRSLGMKAALTAFAGHVPYAIADLYPDADTIPSPNWFGTPASQSQYCCDLLLNFTDPLFEEIGGKFIQIQSKYFGTDHVYQTDTFNEMDPPTNSTAYLNAASAQVYASMQSVDDLAVWLMQGWLFQYHSFWKPAQVRAYVGGVPNDAMIILDLYDDVSPEYSQFSSFFGTPFIWNTLHNFGGNQGLLGTLYNINRGVPEAKAYDNTSIIGVGITMEGIWQNYIIYDETLKMALVDELDLPTFVDKYALRRYGLPHILSSRSTTSEVPNIMQRAWQRLAATVYNVSHWGGVTKSIYSIAPTLSAISAGFMPTQLLYDPIAIQQVWQMLVAPQITASPLVEIEQYRYDLIDISRQAMSDLFFANYVELKAAYNEKNVAKLEQYGQTLLDLMSDLDLLLNTNEFWMLGPWLQMAAQHSSSDNETEIAWWQFNARNQVTLWGPDGEISDYASKTWAGLVGTYHLPQWQMFVDDLIDAVKQNKEFDQSSFNQKNMEKIQQPWQHNTIKFPTKPQNDTLVVACDLYRKWNTMNDTESCVLIIN